MQVLVQTGIRLSECSGLTFGDITFGERSGLLLIRDGKGNKVRSVPLNASAREALAAYVEPRLEVEKVSLKAVVAKWPKPPSARSLEPVWLSQKGGALTTCATPLPAVTWRSIQATWSGWQPCLGISHSIPPDSMASRRCRNWQAVSNGSR